MEIGIKILQFILSFSLLVIIHEMGHFLFARLFKTRVEKFYLFFDPWFSLFKFKRGETEYGIGWVPFGGYVKISGMIDESMDTDQLKEEPKPYEFRSKPAWQRLLIMVGGVTMNILLAVCIYIGISYTWGDTYIATQDVKYGFVFNDLAKEIGFRDGDKIIDIQGQPIEDAGQILPTLVLNQASVVTVEREGKRTTVNVSEDWIPELINSKQFATIRLPFVIGSIPKNSSAASSGLQIGDSLIALNGEQMQYTDQIQKALLQHKGEAVDLTVRRDSAGMVLTKTLPVTLSDEGMIGVNLAPFTQFIALRQHNYTFLEAIPAGIKRTGTELSNYGKQIKLIFSPKTEAYKSVGGLLAIGNIFPNTWSWEAFWQITAILSIMLAVVNILPIPALDGGHVLFLLYEVVTRRKPSDKFLEHAQVVGIFLLLALIIFANGNDIYRFFIK